MVLRRELDLTSGFEGALRLLDGLDLFAFLILGVLVPPIKTNSCFKNEEYVVAGALNFSDGLRDPIGFGKGIVDRVSQFLHEVFQWLFHRVPLNGRCAGAL